MSDPSHSWSRDQVLPLLEQVELFRGLPDGDLQAVLGVVGGLDLDPGEIVFDIGEASDAYYVVADGSVELVRPGVGALEHLGLRGPGEGFGEMALVDDAPRSARARTEGGARLLVIPGDDLRRLLGGDSLPLRLLRLVSRALRVLDAPPADSGAAAPESEGAAPPDGGPEGSAVPAEASGGAEVGAPDASVDVDAASRLIQRRMLSGEAPRVDGFDIAAGTTLERTGRGTTAWDAVALPDGRAALVAFEVRGGGLPPAHVVGTARAALRAALLSGGDLASALARANDALAGLHAPGSEQFVECAMVVPDDAGIEWACAGRVHGGILAREGTFSSLGSHGPPLGMMAGFGYGTERAHLGSGTSVLVLCGGGSGLFRGAADLVAEVQGQRAGEVVETVHRAVRRAREGHEVSVLFLRRH